MINFNEISPGSQQPLLRALRSRQQGIPVPMLNQITPGAAGYQGAQMPQIPTTNMLPSRGSHHGAKQIETQIIVKALTDRLNALSSQEGQNVI